jgi:hypothetical protein
MTPGLDDMEKPAAYQLIIQERLDPSWLDEFNARAVHVENSDIHPAVTIVTGIATDQAALNDILSRVRDLGLPLLLVRCPGEGGFPTNSASSP